MITGGVVAWPVERAHDVLRPFRDIAGRAGYLDNDDTDSAALDAHTDGT